MSAPLPTGAWYRWGRRLAHWHRKDDLGYLDHTAACGRNAWGVSLRPDPEPGDPAARCKHCLRELAKQGKA